MTDSGWLHYRDLKSRCPVCKRPAHIAKRNGNFYFVDDEYNPFVRHAPVKTTEAVFRFFANGYRREHGTEPEVTGNRKLSERDILSGMRQMLCILLKPITTEKEITGHIGDTILSWCEKGQKDDGGNEFRD